MCIWKFNPRYHTSTIARGLVLLFRSSLDWLNQEDATASVWKGYFNVSPRSSLFAHQEGAFSGCYQVRSLGMAFMKNYTNKEIKLNRTAASFNNFFKYWWEYKIPRIILVFNVCLCRITMNVCNNNNNNFICTLH